MNSIKQLNDEEHHEEVHKLLKPMDNNISFLEKEFKNGCIYGLIVDGILVGIYRIYPKKKYLELADIVIKQPYRRKGYGTLLIKHFQKLGKILKYEILRVKTNVDFSGAYTFYSKLKFILIKTIKVKNLTWFIYEKKLK
jgi:GNAT superfamily N-acetyltransferase